MEQTAAKGAQKPGIRIILAVAGLVAAFIMLLIAPFPGDINKGLFIFAVAATLWITEAIHLTATALLVPVLAVALGVFSVEASFSKFSHPIIFIFLGGFALAAALRKTSLDAVIAYRILLFSRGKAYSAIFLVFIVTALLSMWVSNTAVTAMMLPLAVGLIASLNVEGRASQTFILLGLAYSASIGGMGTLVGSPPNAIVGAALNLKFIDWIKIGLPMVLVLLPILIGTLFWVTKPSFESNQSITIKPQKAAPGSAMVLFIFLITVFCWLFGKPIGDMLGVVKYFDAWVAVAAIVLLLITGCLNWKDVEKGADWGVLLLFGGGMALGAVLKQTGASEFIATGLVTHIQGVNFFIFLTLLVCFVIFLTELSSNTATTALLVPLFITIAQQLQFDHAAVAMGIGFAASCAFMLPVATPPNAVVYGSGKVSQQEMMRAGVWLNIIAVLTLPALLYVLL